MANTIVTGDQYMQIDIKLAEIKRQLRQRNGYPFSVKAVESALQRIVEGEFLPEASVAQPATVRSESQTEILKIDRSTPFDPATFMGEGCSIWRGPTNGNGLEGEEQQCEESLTLTEVDIAKITRKTCLKGKEPFVHGEEFLRRLKRGTSLRLDAKIGQTLLENPHRIPKDWKGTCVHFMGTEVRDTSGYRFVLYLCWSGARWNWRYNWLGNNFDSHGPAAVGGKLRRSRAK